LHPKSERRRQIAEEGKEKEQGKKISKNA